MEFFVISVLNGVVHGLLLFMVSAGLTLIFGMMGVLELRPCLVLYDRRLHRLHLHAHDRVLARPDRRADHRRRLRCPDRALHAAPRAQYGHAHELLLTFGLAFIIEEVIKLFYGDFPVNYAMPKYMKFAAFTLYEIDYPFYRLFMGGVAIVIFAVLYLLLTRTRDRHHRAGRDLPAEHG